MTDQTPQWTVGQETTVDGKPVRITKIHPNGTADVEPVEGKMRTFARVMETDPATGGLWSTAGEVMDKGWAEALPTAGGMVGGMLGGRRSLPGIAGAAVGGAVGEAGRAYAQGQPISAGNVLKAGAIQGGGEALGRGLSGGMKIMARKGYQSLLKPTLNQRQEYPNAVQQLLNDRVAITNRGIAKADRNITASSAASEQMVTGAGRSPSGSPGASPIPWDEVTAFFKPIMDRLRLREQGGLDVSADRNAVAGRTAGLQQQGQIGLAESVPVKREMQKLSDAAYRAQERGAQAVTTNDELNKATAAGLRASQEQRVPGLNAQNAITQNRIGGKEMLEQGVGREANTHLFGWRDMGGMGAAGTAGYMSGSPAAAIATYAAIRGVTTPSIGSRVAIGMNETAKLPFAQIVRAAILAKMLAEKDPQK